MRPRYVISLMFIAGLFMTASCGGGAGLESGNIALEVENARQPADIELPYLHDAKGAMSKALAATADTLIVASFRIEISGSGLDVPIVKEFDSETKQMQILGISPGEVSISIEAFNKDKELLRRRKIDEVTIRAGVVTPIKTALNTIPIILNFKDNAVVLSKYFRIVGFGEPGTALSVTANNSVSGDISMNESAAGNGIIVSPSISTGLFEFKPQSVIAGRQTVTIIDSTTGESSSKTVTLVDAEDRPGTMFVPTATLNPASSLGIGMGSEKIANFPQILRTMSSGNGKGVER